MMTGEEFVYIKDRADYTYRELSEKSARVREPLKPRSAYWFWTLQFEDVIGERWVVFLESILTPTVFARLRKEYADKKQKEQQRLEERNAKYRTPKPEPPSQTKPVTPKPRKSTKAVPGEDDVQTPTTSLGSQGAPAEPTMMESADVDH